MARIRHLRNAPIAEAIVDFRVSFPGDFRPVRLREAKGRLAQRYPEALERKGLETRLEIAAGLLDAFEEASTPTGTAMVRIRFQALRWHTRERFLIFYRARSLDQRFRRILTESSRLNGLSLRVGY